jgi:hypothetical protein
MLLPTDPAIWRQALRSRGIKLDRRRGLAFPSPFSRILALPATA